MTGPRLSGTVRDVAHGIADSIRELLDEVIDRLRDHGDDAKVAAAIRKNTRALSSLTTNPPRSNVSENPGQSVDDALAEQTQAIATLSAELADEHSEWLDAVAAGDTGQAEAIVAKVKENTDKLNALSAELAESHPGSSSEPEVNPL